MEAKPTPEQVREWIRSAQLTGDDKRPVVQIVAELAAQWGAAQAQREAENAPWLTTAHMICTDAGIVHGPIVHRLEALRDKLAEQAQQTNPYEDALRSVLNAVNAYLPPDGINANDCLNRVIAAVDPWPANGDQT